VKLDHALLKDLVFAIEDADEGRGVTYYDPEPSKFGERFEQEAKNGPFLDSATRFHLREMENRGWIRLTETHGFSIAEIKPLGHEAADFFRANVWWKKAARYTFHWTDRLLQSVLVPIVVSVLTVLVLQYFGLSK